MTPVLTDILNGSLDAELDDITAAIKQRRSILGDINRLTLMAGTKVRLRGLRPAYLNGLTGTIEGGGRGKRLTVILDRPVARFGSRVNPPATCIEPVA